jgi:glycosyltransferase involved in cell wall biosynthesis
MSVSVPDESRRLRVVQVSFHLDLERRDGESLLRAWPTLPAVATAAARADVDIAVVQRAHRRETIERAGVSYHFIVEPRRRPTRVLECVAQLRPDVVHAQGLNFARAMRSLARTVPGVPLLVQDHGTVPPTGWRAHAWRWAYRSLAGVAFTAREQSTPWKRARILRADLPVFEVLEGSSDFTPGDREAARGATDMFGEPCLLWTSRLNDNKDPLTMLAAVEHAARARPGLRLWCCFGEAPLLDVVKQRVACSTALAERVVLLGARPHEEMELRFRAADFYLQTSHHEGSGFSLLEALACGATPLVTDIPAARQIVGAIGSLTPVGDARSLGDAIVAWAARDQRTLRRAARARFDEALTFDAIGRQLRGVYQTLAGRNTVCLAGAPVHTPRHARDEVAVEPR